MGRRQEHELLSDGAQGIVRSFCCYAHFCNFYLSRKYQNGVPAVKRFF